MDLKEKEGRFGGRKARGTVNQSQKKKITDKLGTIDIVTGDIYSRISCFLDKAGGGGGGRMFEKKRGG